MSQSVLGKESEHSNHQGDASSRLLLVPLSVLGLSTRAYNCLMRAGLRSVHEVASLTDEEILSIRQAGVKTLAEIRRRLNAYLDDHPLSAACQSSELPQEEQASFPEEVSIGVLQLSLDTYKALCRAGILTLRQLTQTSSEELLSTQGIDERGLAEIKERIRSFRVLILPDRANSSDSHESFLPRIDVDPADDRTVVPENTPIYVLDLSTRPCRALTRSGIKTIGQLASTSSEQILAVGNIGWKSLDEIEQKLRAYLTEHSLQTFRPAEPEPEPSTPSIDPALLDSADRALLNDISVDRLGLSLAWQRELLEAGILTIGELLRQGSDVLGKSALLRDRVERYLTWLVEQDEVAWADEVAGVVISPMHRIELSQKSLCGLIEDWLTSVGSLDDRDRQVIRWRYGLDGHRMTLQEIGDRLGVSRERVRQLEKRALNYLRRPQHRASVRLLGELLMHLLKQAGGLMNETEIESVLQEQLPIGGVDPASVTHLVLQVNPNVRWLRATKAWGLKSAPLDQVRGVQKRLIRLLKKEGIPLSVERVVSRFMSTRFYLNRQETLEDGFILACLRVDPDVSVSEEGQCGLAQWERHRIAEMILALREIGKPAHYTEIADMTNALLKPDMQASARSIHAHILRRSDVFVRVGHGVYGLAEWGLHDDGSVANAAFRVLDEAGKPLHYDMIADRVLETWCVNRASVYAALQSDDRFIGIGSGVYWLREKLAEGGDKGEVDFGELFGDQLEQRQEEILSQEKKSNHNTHAEVEAIRQMGTDFFK